ncbi:P1 family peptidase [Psychromarinibacter halotolerans]|uniref:P1 family peptidase n=1 Tax=Psychromarinibacter halotolerans TaxID=1775175 RepID=A0ABV7H2U6_9RHOB|nr:P1 family peptidase [Psychromarinibacter halotolerans]MDF0596400.1 P1 family peptidase [Psychromarinibacter halotolerans]
MKPGPLNLITDVAGLVVGNAEDHAVKTGTTVLTSKQPFTAAVHVMGGAPGTRETDLLAPDRTVQQVHALVLSGGSALGLSAASGVADAMRARGQGLDVAGQIVPIVPAAIVFDLVNGGDKDWSVNPYPALGEAALSAASDTFDLGTAGAGTGATTAGLKGGLGSASVVLPSGVTVGALVVVNALGSATVDDGPHFWAAPFELGDEFGGRGPAAAYDPLPFATKHGLRNAATTIAIVATDAALDQAQATRVATAAHDGMARALVPSHTPSDGDLVFAAATGARALADPAGDLLEIGHAAALCLSRAIARGVFHATGAKADPFPTWQDRFA